VTRREVIERLIYELAEPLADGQGDHVVSIAFVLDRRRAFVKCCDAVIKELREAST
jgi:hypothetical protein